MAGAPRGWDVFSGPIESRSDMTKQDFDREIDGHGADVVWEQACPCPCTNNDQTDQADPLCPYCDGIGWEYYAPTPIKVIVDRPGITVRQQEKQGVVWTGDVNITTRIENPLAYFHRVTMSDVTIEFCERTVRKALDQQALKAVIASRSVEYVLRTTQERQTVVERINRLAWYGSDRVRHVLREGVDFDVTDDGKIDWRKGDRCGTAPPPGAMLTANYYTNPRYVVTSLTPYAYRTTKTLLNYAEPTITNLPYTVSATLDYRLHRKVELA